MEASPIILNPSKILHAHVFTIPSHKIGYVSSDGEKILNLSNNDVLYNISSFVANEKIRKYMCLAKDIDEPEKVYVCPREDEITKLITTYPIENKLEFMIIMRKLYLLCMNDYERLMFETGKIAIVDSNLEYIDETSKWMREVMAAKPKTFNILPSDECVIGDYLINTKNMQITSKKTKSIDRITVKGGGIINESGSGFIKSMLDVVKVKKNLILCSVHDISKWKKWILKSKLTCTVILSEGSQKKITYGELFDSDYTILCLEYLQQLATLYIDNSEKGSITTMKEEYSHYSNIQTISDASIFNIDWNHLIVHSRKYLKLNSLILIQHIESKYRWHLSNRYDGRNTFHIVVHPLLNHLYELVDGSIWHVSIYDDDMKLIDPKKNPYIYFNPKETIYQNIKLKTRNIIVPHSTTETSIIMIGCNLDLLNDCITVDVSSASLENKENREITYCRNIIGVGVNDKLLSKRINEFVTNCINEKEECCPICYTKLDFNVNGGYELIKKIPSITGCNHIFCYSCIKQFFKFNEEKKEGSVCPMCREKIELKTIKIIIPLREHSKLNCLRECIKSHNGEGETRIITQYDARNFLLGKKNIKISYDPVYEYSENFNVKTIIVTDDSFSPEKMSDIFFVSAVDVSDVNVIYIRWKEEISVIK